MTGEIIMKLKDLINELCQLEDQYGSNTEVKIVWDDTPMKDGVYEYYNIDEIFYDADHDVVVIESDDDS